MDERPRSRGRSQDPRFAQAVGRTIKVLRTDRGLERKDLAEQVGISYSYLTEIENGNKPPSHSVLSTIAEVLGVHLHQLIADAEWRVAPDETTALPPRSGPAPAADLLALDVDPRAMWESVDASRAPTGADTPEVRLRPGLPSPGQRRRKAVQGWVHAARDGSAEELRPTYPGRADRDAPAAVSARSWELQEIASRLSPEDLERVLDLARRLAR